MAHRKGEKEALRRQREEREAKARAEQQRKRLVGIGAAGVLVLAAAVIGFLLVGGGANGEGPGGGANVFPEGGDVAEQKIFDVEEAASAAGCELSSSESRGDRDRAHRSQDRTIEYRDNPPTLGSHWPPGFEAQDGLYAKSPADESLVHTLEHGRVIFWAKPSLPENARESLRALFDEDTYQLVMVPRQNMPYAVAATAWNRDPVPGGTGRTLGCDEWSPEAVDALRAFRDQHRSNGPEPVP